MRENNKQLLRRLENSLREYNKDELIDIVVNRKNVSPNINEWADEQKEISQMLSQRIENDTSPERPYIAQIYKEAGSTRYSGLGFVPTNTIDTRQEDGTGHIGVLGILNGRCTGYIAPIKHDRVIQIDTIIGDSMEQILTEAGILTETNIYEPVFGNNDFKQFPNGI